MATRKEFKWKGRRVAVALSLWGHDRGFVVAWLTALGAVIDRKVTSDTEIFVASSVGSSADARTAAKLGAEVIDELELAIRLDTSANRKAMPSMPAPGRKTARNANINDGHRLLTQSKALLDFFRGKEVRLGAKSEFDRTSLLAAIGKGGGNIKLTRRPNILLLGSPSDGTLVLDRRGRHTLQSSRWKSAGNLVDDAGLWMLSGEQPPSVKGPLAGWIQRFDAMVKLLRAHKDIAVLACAYGPPVSEARLKAVEARLGGALPTDLKNFYRQADGVSLVWVHRKSATKASLKALTPTVHRRLEAFEAQELSRHAHGVVNVLPLEDLLFKYDWKGILWFPKTMRGSDLEFYKNLRVFDWFHFFSLAALQMKDGPSKARVHYGSDHGADFDQRESVSVEAYLEGVLAGFGSERASVKAGKTRVQKSTKAGLAELLQRVEADSVQ